MKRLAGAFSALIMIGATVALAVPASAAVTVTLNARNGTVGVTQTIDAQVLTPGIGGEGTVTFTVGSATIGTDTVGPTQGYDAQVNWTPAASGRQNVTATFSGGGSDTTSVTIASVATTTAITSPGSATAGSTIALTAQVRTKAGSYVPTGAVKFYLSSGTQIGSGSLNGLAIASMNYQVPNINGSVSFYAVYQGDNNAENSAPSPTTTTRVSAQGSSVALVVAQTNYLNSSVPLVANITPASGTGTVTFTVDGRSVGTANVANGTASVTWVPTALGNPRITATYSGGNSVTGSSDSKTVAVIQPLKPDVITIDPVGAQGPILNNAVFVMPNGASTQVSLSASSGQPVTIGVVGPCAWNAATSTLSVQGVGGNCTITATTPGGNGYAPGKLVFSVSTSVGAQTATVAAPKSGTYAKGKTLTLAKAGTVTNLNKPITWKVTSGGSSCKVSLSKGAAYLKLVKAGKCAVTGSAPAVPGQWSAYSTSRNYTVK